jgi:hypothetical protein
VSGVPTASVGHVAVWSGPTAGTLQIQAQLARTNGRNASAYGLDVQDIAKVEQPFGGARGIPPRGRPV